MLQPVVLSFVQQHHVVLQDDNAIPHRARIVQQFLQQNNVDHLDWPARSPDVANRACLGRSRPACTTESSMTKNAPSFGRSLAGGVEEDKFSHSLLVLQTQTDGFLSVNEMM